MLSMCPTAKAPVSCIRLHKYASVGKVLIHQMLTSAVRVGAAQDAAKVLSAQGYYACPFAVAIEEVSIIKELTRYPLKRKANR